MNETLERLCLKFYDYIEQEQTRRRERGEQMLDKPRLGAVAIGSFLQDSEERARLLSSGEMLIGKTSTAWQQGPLAVRRLFWFLSADAMGALPGESQTYVQDWVNSLADNEWRKLGDDFYDANMELIAECFLEMGNG